jgi:CDP-diacylglycerol--glycerol-3-phosphate 3-phosphatidyltransferase
MNLATKLTILRLILTPTLFLLYLDNPYATTLVFLGGVAVGISDILDGYIARRRKTVTSFGKLADPLVDKIYVLVALIFLVDLHMIPSWMVVVIIVRELVITGLRAVAAARGEVIPAMKLGKIKTVLQMSALGVAALYRMAEGSLFLSLDPEVLEWAEAWGGWAVKGAMLVAVIVTTFSGIDYLIRIRKYILDA